MKKLLESNWKATPPELAHKIHHIVKKITNTQDPYMSVKKESNDLVLKLYPELEKTVKQNRDPQRTAVKLAIAGNIIDFGAKETFDIKNTIKTVLKTPFAIDDYEYFRKEITTAHTLVYLADNSGEIVFDKLLLETILKIGNIQKITFVVKGMPFLNDAMLEDAQDIGLDRIPQIKFFQLGVGFPETGSGKTSPSFLTMLKRSDLVISKGQANYEDLCNQDYISFLLMVKCPVVARHLNVPVGSTILRGPHHLSYSKHHISSSTLNLMKMK